MHWQISTNKIGNQVTEDGEIVQYHFETKGFKKSEAMWKPFEDEILCLNYETVNKDKLLLFCLHTIGSSMYPSFLNEDILFHQTKKTTLSQMVSNHQLQVFETIWLQKKTFPNRRYIAEHANIQATNNFT